MSEGLGLRACMVYSKSLGFCRACDRVFKGFKGFRS